MKRFNRRILKRAISSNRNMIIKNKIKHHMETSIKLNVKYSWLRLTQYHDITGNWSIHGLPNILGFKSSDIHLRVSPMARYNISYDNRSYRLVYPSTTPGYDVFASWLFTNRLSTVRYRTMRYGEDLSDSIYNLMNVKKNRNLTLNITSRNRNVKEYTIAKYAANEKIEKFFVGYPRVRMKLKSLMKTYQDRLAKNKK